MYESADWWLPSDDHSIACYHQYTIGWLIGNLNESHENGLFFCWALWTREERNDARTLTRFAFDCWFFTVSNVSYAIPLRMTFSICRLWPLFLSLPAHHFVQSDLPQNVIPIDYRIRIDFSQCTQHYLSNMYRHLWSGHSPSPQYFDLLLL